MFSLDRPVLRYAISFGAIAAVVAVLYRIPRISPTTVALCLLLVIIFIAAGWGLRVAVASAVLATLAFNYFFLPPIGTLTIADTQNWVALFAFLTSAVIASHLSERVRREAEEARQRRNEVEKLYSFSQQLLVQENPRTLLKEVPREIAMIFGATSAALYLLGRDKMYRFGGAHTIPAESIKVAAVRGEPVREPGGHFCIAPLRMGVKSVGAIGFAGEQMSNSSLEALGSLVAMAVERANTVESLAHAEAARESERLRTALLDSVTHDLRTPLTSIKASVSSLRSGMELQDSDRADLLAVIEEETDRLNRLVGEAVEMAQLDESRVQLQLTPHDIRGLIVEVKNEMATLRERHPIEVLVPDGIPKAVFDPEWIKKVLRHLLENAAKYSADGSPIFVTAEQRNKEIVTSVADRGSGIDDMEKNMIFDKFYRGQSQRYRTQGTGMGLAIVKGIINAHHGRVDVTSQLGQGSVFSFTLPVWNGTNS